MGHLTQEKAARLHRYAGWASKPDDLYPGLKDVAPGLFEGPYLPECLVNDRLLRDRVGGKAVGLLRLEYVRQSIAEEYGSPVFEIPKYKLWGTDRYTDFLKRNNLTEERLLSIPEEQRNSLFNEGFFSPADISSLREIFREFRKKPVAVRSSGRFEYRKESGYYGRFKTEFLANQTDEEADFKLFLDRIKSVYASTWSDSAIAYRNERGISHQEDWMGIVFQEMVGKWRTIQGQEVFAPDVSGVMDQDPYRPHPFNAENFGLNTLTMDGYCIQDVMAGRRSEYNKQMEYNPEEFRCQALGKDSSIVEFTLEYSPHASKELIEMHESMDPWRSKKRESPELEKLILKAWGTPSTGLPVVFERTNSILDEPQRMEYSVIDNKLYIYQYSLSANYSNRLKNPVDTRDKGVVVAKVEDSENILGHGEFTGPVVWIKRPSGVPDLDNAYLSREALELAERRFPGGYILMVDNEQKGESYFDMAYLRGRYFEVSENDRVVAKDETGFVLKDTETGEKSRGERRVEYPKVKGLVVFPKRKFMSTGHHLEGVIEANTLGISGDFNPEEQLQLFEAPIECPTFVKTYGKPDRTVPYQMYVSRNPMRIAVDGLKRSGILHST